MTCHDARPLLPDLAYDDLPADEAAAIRRHLDDCPGCRDELAGLAFTRAALGTSSAPVVRVNVSSLFTQVATQQERQARWWRRASLVAVAIAAGLLLVIGLRLQVRIGAGQLVFAWGSEPASRERERPEDSQTPVAHAPGSPESPQPTAAVQEELRLLRDLTHALAANLDRQDRGHRQEMTDLGRRLDGFQRVAAEKWAEAERFFSALYVAQFKPSDGGNKP